MSHATQQPGGEQPAASGQPPSGGPTFVINNNARASAVAGTRGVRGLPRKRQSAMVHLLLFLFTAGLGNIFYAWHVMSWNRRHGM